MYNLVFKFYINYNYIIIGEPYTIYFLVELYSIKFYRIIYLIRLKLNKIVNNSVYFIDANLQLIL